MTGNFPAVSGLLCPLKKEMMTEEKDMKCAGNEDDFSRLEINISNCRYNYRYFRGLLKPSTKLLILVKANAYGHGAVEFASMMESLGAD